MELHSCSPAECFIFSANKKYEKCGSQGSGVYFDFGTRKLGLCFLFVCFLLFWVNPATKGYQINYQMVTLVKHLGAKASDAAGEQSRGKSVIK